MGENDGDHDRISPTARMVAYLRSFSDIPYAKQTSDALKGEETSRKILQEDFDVTVRFAAPLVEARYKGFNPVINGKKNILELALGTSIERGLGLSDDPETIYVGTDLSDMIRDSSEFFNRINSRPRPNHYLQAANVLSYCDLESATSHFNGRKDLAIIHEGLWQYIKPEEQPLAAENIRRILSKFGGLWATPDITDKESRVKLIESLGPEMKTLMPRLMRRITEFTGSNIEENAFATKKAATNFLYDAGFNVTEYSMIFNLDELSSVRNLGWSEREREFYGPSIKQRNVWVMRLR